MRISGQRVNNQNGIIAAIVKRSIGFIGQRNRTQPRAALQRQFIRRSSKRQVLGLNQTHRAVVVFHFHHTRGTTIDDKRINVQCAGIVLIV